MGEKLKTNDFFFWVSIERDVIACDVKTATIRKKEYYVLLLE